MKEYFKMTVVIAIKDRDKDRAFKCLQSLSEQTKPCNIMLVDYGSTTENILWERELIKKYPNLTFIEVKLNTEVFNKSRALNIGLKGARTKYVISSDIDCIFARDFIEKVERVLLNIPKALVLCQKIDLNEKGEQTGTHEPSASGSCIGIEFDWIKKVHGYDETYTLWGREDNDLVDRAVADGYQVIWITEQTKIWHQWHKPASQKTLEENTWYYQIPNKPLIRNPNGWGEL